MKINKKDLVCKNINFLNNHDEEAFFEWIKKITCIGRYYSLKNKIYLEIVSDIIFWEDIKDLIGLFYRYDIDIKQLKRFLTDNEKKIFFKYRHMSWHSNVWPLKNNIEAS